MNCCDGDLCMAELPVIGDKTPLLSTDGFVLARDVTTDTELWTSDGYERPVGVQRIACPMHQHGAVRGNLRVEIDGEAVKLSNIGEPVEENDGIWLQFLDDQKLLSANDVVLIVPHVQTHGDGTHAELSRAVNGIVYEVNFI